MAQFLSENWGNILVLAAVFAVAAAVAVRMVRRRKSGKSGCSCGCEACASRGICHPNQ